jgi:hypothetical protein
VAERLVDVVKPHERPRAAEPGRQAEPPLVLVHIPRTAGTTLAMILRHHYRGGEFHGGGNVFARSDEIEDRLREIAGKVHVRAVSGHLTFGLADRILPAARYVAILRDPVDRTLSHYSALLRARPAEPGTPRRTGLLPPWLPSVPPRSGIAELIEGGYIADNLQTRMLCGIVSPHDELPVDALDRARRNLRDRFAFVGTTERFDALLALMNLELGWPTMAYRRSRAKGRVTRAELTPDALALVEERNALDRELHACAGDLLAEALGRAGSEAEAEREVLEEAALRWSERRGAGTAEIRSLAPGARVVVALKEAELARTEVHRRRLERAVKRSKRMDQRRES